jgi:hypothetical protein
MEKNTKILLGLGAVIAAYLILKPKKAAAQTSVVASTLDEIELKKVIEQVKNEVIDVVTPDTDKKNLEPDTKLCVLKYYKCNFPTIFETIKIPIYDDCGKYQPERPACEQLDIIYIGDSALEVEEQYYNQGSCNDGYILLPNHGCQPDQGSDENNLEYGKRLDIFQKNRIQRKGDPIWY